MSATTPAAGSVVSMQNQSQPPRWILHFTSIVDSITISGHIKATVKILQRSFIVALEEYANWRPPRHSFYKYRRTRLGQQVSPGYQTRAWQSEAIAMLNATPSEPFFPDHFNLSIWTRALADVANTSDDLPDVNQDYISQDSRITGNPGILSYNFPRMEEKPIRFCALNGANIDVYLDYDCETERFSHLEFVADNRSNLHLKSTAIAERISVKATNHSTITAHSVVCAAVSVVNLNNSLVANFGVRTGVSFSSERFLWHCLWMDNSRYRQTSDEIGSDRTVKKIYGWNPSRRLWEEMRWPATTSGMLRAMMVQGGITEDRDSGSEEDEDESAFALFQRLLRRSSAAPDTIQGQLDQALRASAEEHQNAPRNPEAAVKKRARVEYEDDKPVLRLKKRPSDEESENLKEADQAKACVICYDRKRTHWSLGCGHALYCDVCVHTVVEKGEWKVCSLCNTRSRGLTFEPIM